MVVVQRNKILQDIYELAEEELEAKKKFIPGSTRIPATYPDLQAIDVASLAECVLGYWYTEHRWAAKFKELLKENVLKDYVSLTNSGSSASLAAMTAVTQVRDDNRNLVLTCATGFPTTVSPIYQCGKIPFYIDIDPETLSPDLTQVRQALRFYGDEICGAIFAHTLGFPFNELEMRQLLGDGRFLISDCCDALGAEIEVENERHPVGGFSDMSTYSFFPAHHITTAEGGCVATNSDVYAEALDKVINWGRSCYCLPGQQNTCGKRFSWEERGDLPEGWDHKYIFDVLGYNLKMTDLQAALGYSQLMRLEELNKKRSDNYAYLRRCLLPLYGRIYFPIIPEWSYPSPFGFPIDINEPSPEKASKFVAHLQKHNIETRRVFGGNLTKQPGFKNLPCRGLSLDGSDTVMNYMIWISSSPTLTREMMDYMVEVVFDYF